MTTSSDIRRWIHQAPKGTTHVLIITDTFDFSNYPVYVSKDDDVKEEYLKYHEKNMQHVREIYNLSMDLDKQLEDGIVHNF